MRLYVSGPMTGLPEKNYPAFNEATRRLRSEGHDVYNPAEYKDGGRTFELRAAFREYTDFICGADAIYMLPGWERSIGARAEHALAVAVGLTVLYG